MNVLLTFVCIMIFVIIFLSMIKSDEKPRKFKKRIVRHNDHNKEFVVIDECETDFCVIDNYDYAQSPRSRQLIMWWDKKYCKVVKE